MPATPQNQLSATEFLGGDEGDASPYVAGNPTNPDSEVNAPPAQSAEGTPGGEPDAIVETDDGIAGADPNDEVRPPAQIPPEPLPKYGEEGDKSAATPPPPVEGEASAEDADPTALAVPTGTQPEKAKPWSKLHQANRELTELKEQLRVRDEADALRAREIQELREWRAAQDAQALARQQLIAEQTANAQQASRVQRPGIDRPFTQEERQQFKDYDPIAYNEYVALEAQQENQRLAQRQQELEDRITLQADIDTFKSTTPDYVDAVRYLEADERRLYVAAGLDEQKVTERIQLRTAELVYLARMNGRSVAATAYEMAKARGYAGVAAAATAQANVAALAANANAVAQGATQNGAQAPSAPKLTPQQLVQQSQQRNAVASASLANVTGNGGGRTPITRAQFLAMSEEEIWKRDEADPNWVNEIVEG